VVQSWIRQALRASGVAILVPAAIVAAIALSVVGGGDSARSLSQILSGPAVPPAEAAKPPAVHARRAPLQGQSPQSRAPLRGQSPQSRAPRRAPVVTTLPQRPRRPSHARPPAKTPPAPGRPAPAPAPPPPSAPAPRPIHDTGTQVAETVRPLPVAGPVAADAVEAVVDLVDPPA
jgi:hypothetical protein